MKTREIVDNEFEKIILKELDGINDLELLILKGHILIEFSLNKFISDLNDGGIDVDKTNFSFYSKIYVAELLGLFKSKDHLKVSIVDINKLRNQIAHKLSFDKKLLEKIIAVYIKLNVSGSKVDKAKSDFENLYYIIIAVCGLIMGKKIANQKIKRFTFDQLKLLMKENPEKFSTEFNNYGK